MKIILKRFTANNILNTRGATGFRQNKDGSYRQYDTAMDRLGRGYVTREITKAPQMLKNEIKAVKNDLNGTTISSIKEEVKFDPNAMNNELRSMNNELNKGRLGRWQHID